MAKKQLSDHQAGEALGNLHSLPFDETLPEVSAEIPEVADSTIDFQMAIGHAQMEGIEYIEVSEKLFAYLMRKSKSSYITYGDPGVKVFKVGTRDEILREESMNAESYHDHITKKRQAARGK